MRSLRLWATAAAVAVALVAAVVLALAFTASPASAYGNWAHDGAMGCVVPRPGHADRRHAAPAATPASRATPDDTCWSCHEPGMDTSTLSTPSSACSQECHTWNAIQKQYINPFTHGSDPHLGVHAPSASTATPRAPSVVRPGRQPPPQRRGHGLQSVRGVPLVSAEARREGRLRELPHHRAGVPSLPGEQPGLQEVRRLPHHEARPQEGRPEQVRAVPQGHPTAARRSTPPRSPRSPCAAAATRKALHASRVSKSVKNCGTCHRGKYHAAQRTPGKSVCTRCHSVAKRHDNGFQCTLCHRRAVHNRRPSSVNL